MLLKKRNYDFYHHPVYIEEAAVTVAAAEMFAPCSCLTTPFKTQQDIAHTLLQLKRFLQLQIYLYVICSCQLSSTRNLLKLYSDEKGFLCICSKRCVVGVEQYDVYYNLFLYE